MSTSEGELIKTIHSLVNNMDYPSGWLNPDGVLLPCGWGQHESDAFEHIKNNDWLDDAEYTLGDYAGDFLILKKRWILLDCPSGNGLLKITYRINSMTKKQKEYLSNYMISIRDDYGLKQILQV